MTKVKKIVAAAAAALTIGAMSVTAFADGSGLNKSFALKFKAYEQEVFTSGNTKGDSYADPAAVRVTKGANALAPVEFSVWNIADELYGAQLTYSATVTANEQRREMPYYSTTGTVYPNTLYYLHAYAMVDKDIEGVWAP